jgi:hypothetical protein
MKLLAAAAFAFALLVLPPTTLAQEEPAPPSASLDFYPAKYLGQGNIFN